MTTEFQPNIVAYGDVAGFGQWLAGHFRQHLNYNNHLANTVNVRSITLTAGGTGYTVAPAVSITGGAGHDAAAVAGVSAGAVNSLILINRGVNYGPNDVLSVVFGGPGTGAAATVQLSQTVQLPIYPIMAIVGDLKFWLDAHETWHELLRPLANIQGINLADVNFNDASQFDQWLSAHAQEHAELDLAFALT